MHLTGFFVQFLNGLAEASSLFLVASGLSLIFGVSRIVNFAHGSLYMLGLYAAYHLVAAWGASVLGFWASVLAAGVLMAALGALIELVLLRRLYHAPELFQLLGTFALVLIFNDMALSLWGPDDLLGPLAPGLDGSVQIFDRYIPVYDLVLIGVGPLVLVALWLLLQRTKWGTLIRAATQDRDMLAALGVNQAWLFTGVFALGAFLAGLGGALQLPRQPASLMLDLGIIGDVFVVVVVGGMGSVPGAFIAALIIAELKALCVALGVVEFGGLSIAFPKLTLVVEFIFMALVLVFRPWGLMGKPISVARGAAAQHLSLRPMPRRYHWIIWLIVAVLAGLPWLVDYFPYAPVLAQDLLIAVLFAVSLHFMMGLGGMPSFGHAAYFGVGAYAVALLYQSAAWPAVPTFFAAPFAAAIAALLFGWFCVRLTGVYLAMLTLAFAQIVWAIVFQWDDVTGGSNGMFGLWPPDWMAGDAYYYWVLFVVAGLVVLVRRMAFSPFGYALRALRDSALRADAIGINVKRVQWAAFVISGLLAGVAGSLYAFAKGSVSPELLGIGRSVDALVMVLLGGVQTLAGPVVGASVFTLLQDFMLGITEYWRAWLGAIILMIVLAFPQGLAGYVAAWTSRREARA